MKQKYHQEKSSTLGWTTVVYLMGIMSMHRMSGKNLTWRRWVITITIISKEMFSHWQTCLRNSKTFFMRIMSSKYKLGISLFPDWLGMLPWRRQTLILNYSLVLICCWLLKKEFRGGVSMISNHFAWANNPYMGEAYDPSKPTKYITCLDANNLYGCAMCEPLPVGNFK